MSDAAAEQSLVSQDVLVLPDSGAVVVPLKHDSLLVGLLVLEQTRPAQQGAEEWVAIDQGHSGRSVDVSMDEADAPGTTPWGVGGVLRDEAQWEAVQDVAASLSSACTLEQRATLELAYHMAGRSSLQGLVAEVSQPLRTLRTLGALLAPRVGDEAGNRDMVEGIMAQGDRLQQVVRSSVSGSCIDGAACLYTLVCTGESAAGGTAPVGHPGTQGPAAIGHPGRGAEAPCSKAADEAHVGCAIVRKALSVLLFVSTLCNIVILQPSCMLRGTRQQLVLGQQVGQRIQDHPPIPARVSPRQQHAHWRFQLQRQVKHHFITHAHTLCTHMHPVDKAILPDVVQHAQCAPSQWVTLEDIGAGVVEYQG